MFPYVILFLILAIFFFVPDNILKIIIFSSRKLIFKLIHTFPFNSIKCAIQNLEMNKFKLKLNQVLFIEVSINGKVPSTYLSRISKTSLNVMIFYKYPFVNFNHHLSICRIFKIFILISCRKIYCFESCHNTLHKIIILII